MGISTLLTTTMLNMEKIVKELKSKFGGIRIIVGGAPLTKEFADKIGAAYSPDPPGASGIFERRLDNPIHISRSS